MRGGLSSTTSAGSARGSTSSTRRADRARAVAAARAAQRADASRPTRSPSTRTPSLASGIAVAPEPAYASTTERGCVRARPRRARARCSRPPTSAFTCANDALAAELAALGDESSARDAPASTRAPSAPERPRRTAPRSGQRVAAFHHDRRAVVEQPNRRAQLARPGESAARRHHLAPDVAARARR